MSAQSADIAAAPPAILQIQREFLKPGKSGNLHERSEAAFVRAQDAAKSHIYYLGMNSLSGPSLSMFVSGFPTFAALEHENAMIAANPSLSTAFDKATLSDGDLLNAYETAIFSYRRDLSLVSGKSIISTRFAEYDQWRVKPGHEAEFKEIADIYADGFKKAMPGVDYAVYQSQYGKDNGSLFLVILNFDSLAGADALLQGLDKMAAAEGKETMARLDALQSSAIESVQSNLFQVSPP